MYYEYDGVKYNLGVVVSIVHLKDYIKPGFFHQKKDEPETKFLGLFSRNDGRKKNQFYALDFFDNCVLSTKEKALYKDSEVKIKFVGDKHYKVWDLKTEEEAQYLIWLVEHNGLSKKELDEIKEIISFIKDASSRSKT